MGSDQLKNLHLFTMQSVLPLGIGIYNKAKAGGVKKIIEVFKSNDPLSDLQIDGEKSAKDLRNQIDQLIPGLGNPVVSVDVTVDENYSDPEIDNQDTLVFTLNRIDDQLDELSQYLKNDFTRIDE